MFSSEQKIRFSKEQCQRLQKLRIIQKNLVHFQGFPDSLNDQNILIQKSHFGQFGKITKIVLVSKNEENQKKKTNSAYITFSKKEEASFAILSMDSLVIEGHLVRAFFGTSKYCIHFLNNKECKNKEKCMFIHYLVNDNEILGINSKFDYNDHLNLAKKILGFNSPKNNYEINCIFDFNKVNNNIKNLNINLKDDFSDGSTTYSLRKNSISSVGSCFSDNINNNNINNINNNNKINQNENNIFKSKEESRFFCRNNSNINNYKINFIISEQLKKLIDDVCIRKGFFLKFSDYYNIKYSEIEFCKNKYEMVDDNLIKYVLKNTF